MGEGKGVIVATVKKGAQTTAIKPAKKESSFMEKE